MCLIDVGWTLWRPAKFGDETFDRGCDLRLHSQKAVLVFQNRIPPFRIEQLRPLQTVALVEQRGVLRYERQCVGCVRVRVRVAGRALHWETFSASRSSAVFASSAARCT